MGLPLLSARVKVAPARASIRLTCDWDEAFGDADLVIEAVAEDPAQKIAFYEELRKHLPEKAIVVTNSSTLLPSQFAAYTGRPEKYLALYRLNPMTPVIELFRAAFLGAGSFDGTSYVISLLVTAAVLMTGLVLFNRIEKTFMDTV